MVKLFKGFEYFWNIKTTFQFLIEILLHFRNDGKDKRLEVFVIIILTDEFLRECVVCEYFMVGRL